MARIQFVVNTTGLTGGIRVVFEYANRLQRRGHQVSIVHPYDLTGKTWPTKEGWRALAKRVKYAIPRKVDWFDLETEVIRVPRISDRHIPDADVVIATANETADWVARLSPSKGRKYYFIQHVEDWSRDPRLVQATWKLPLKKIVIASWLKEYANALGEEVVACITNGVNLEKFHPGGREHHIPPKVLMMTHHLAWKGTADGFAAIKLLRDKGVRVELTLFGADQHPGDMHPDTKFILRPTGEELRLLYATHDIFISPSWKEGCQLPPMEAMACGCAVIATNVGGIPDYAVPGETALVVDPQRPDQLANALECLLTNEALCRSMGEKAMSHISSFTWDAATDSFESVLGVA